VLTGSCHCGKVGWTLANMPRSLTACNCTICRRYGALWAYGFIGSDVEVSSGTTGYRRKDGGELEFHFCPTCGCAVYNRAVQTGDDGRIWVAVNCRMSDPVLIANLPIDHFDGHDTWQDLPPDGRTVKDMWF
jgi:hypothetical protein